MTSDERGNSASLETLGELRPDSDRSLAHIQRGDQRHAPPTNKPLIGEHNKEADAKANAVYHGTKHTKWEDVKAARKLLALEEALDSLAGIEEPDEFENKVQYVFDEALNLLFNKHAMYGHKNISSAPGGPITGLRVRIWDKLARINNIVDNQVDDVKFESLRDSFIDLANYALIACLVLDGDWPTE